MSQRFAIIGCGTIGARHARHIASRGVLAAVCDSDPNKCRQMATDYGAVAYLSLSELLGHEKIDVLVVCTPNGLHPEHSIAGLLAGCHVLCEKPLAISSPDGLRMIETSQKTGKRLFVVKQNRFNPPVKAAKKLLDSGALGNIFGFQLNCFWHRPREYYHDTWRGKKALDGGILFTQFSHFTDLLYWFLGELQSVSGRRSNILHQGVIEFEDAGVAELQMKNGAAGTLNYHINAHNTNMEGSFTLFGTRGTIKIGGQYLNRLEYFSVDGEEMPAVAPSGAPNDYGYYQGSMSNHDIVYDELLRALDDLAYPFLEASEALKSVQIIEQIYAASPLTESPWKP